MKHLLTAALLLLLAAPAWAVTLRATWEPPMRNTDGTPITDLSHYELLMDYAPIPQDADKGKEVWTIDATSSTAEVTHDKPANVNKLYFRVRACNSAGVCSAWSNQDHWPRTVPMAVILHVEEAK